MNDRTQPGPDQPLFPWAPGCPHGDGPGNRRIVSTAPDGAEQPPSGGTASPGQQPADLPASAIDLTGSWSDPGFPARADAAAAGPGTQASADAVDLVGVVNGTVSIETSRERFWGMRMLAAATAAAGLIVIVRLATSGSTRPELLLYPPLVPLALLAAHRMLLGSWFDRATTGGHGAHPAGSPAGAGRFASARRSGGMVGGCELTLRRLRVQPLAGGTLACIMFGELTGDEMRHGDVIRVVGRRARDGHCVVRRIQVLASPVGPVISQVKGRPSIGFRSARLTSRLGFVLSAATLAWLAFVLAGLLG